MLTLNENNPNLKSLQNVSSSNFYSYENNSLTLYIGKRLVQRIPVSQSKSAQVGIIIIQGGCIILASCGTIPYANISLDLAGKNALGYSLVVGNTASFSALNSWALLKMINTESNFIKTKNQELNKNCSKCKNWSLKAICVILGVTSQIPLAYLAYTYNDQKWGYAVLTLASDSGFPSYSLFLTFDALQKKRNMTPFEKKLQATREFLVNRIQDNLKKLLELPFEQRQSIVLELNDIHERADLTPINKCYIYFARLFYPLVEEEQIVESSLKTAGRWIAKGFGGLLTVSRLGIISITSYKAIELFTDSMVACGVSSALITGCNTYLTYDVLVKVSGNSYDKIVDLFHGKISPSLSSILYPKISFGLKTVGVLIAGWSWGPSYKASYDYAPEGVKTLAGVTVSVGAAILVINALIDLTSDLIEFYAEKRGESEKKELAELMQRIHQLTLLFQRISLIDFTKFLLTLPAEIFTECALQGNFSTQELIDYLSLKEDDSLPLFR